MIHGMVDGYSRLILYCKCVGDNEAQTVLRLFIPACQRYGLPSRTRHDHGGENKKIALLMNLIRGTGRGSALLGKSVHNQRIERMWKDIRYQVLENLRQIFYNMEDDGHLDISSSRHLQVLHYVYLPVINRRLSIMVQAWNKHPISTQECQTPEQLFHNGMLANMHSGHAATEYMFGEISMENHLHDSLAQYNITLDQLEVEGGPNEPTDVLTPTAEILSIMASDDSDLQKYKQILNEL